MIPGYDLAPGIKCTLYQDVLSANILLCPLTTDRPKCNLESSSTAPQDLFFLLGKSFAKGKIEHVRTAKPHRHRHRRIDIPEEAGAKMRAGKPMPLSHRLKTGVFSYCGIILSILVLIVGFARTTSSAAAEAWRYNGDTIGAIDEEIAVCTDERYFAVLRGLRWCVAFCNDEARFDFTFSNYVTMLDELTLQRSHTVLTRIVHDLIVREFERALPRFPRLFNADLEGYEEFVSILPIAYRHQVPAEPLREFAARHFAGVAPRDRRGEFRQAAKHRDYDLLTDLVVDEAFTDMAYGLGIDKWFRLPPDNYHIFMTECASIPLRARFGDEAYHDQNYYATHVVLALVHYGQRPLPPSAAGDKVFSYLSGQYDRVRNRVNDLDLLCEYLYCFRQFGQASAGFVREGECYVLSLQRTDGSWGNFDDFAGDPYDQLHPTWTAITLLVQD
jgi:hypothetical protein